MEATKLVKITGKCRVSRSLRALAMAAALVAGFAALGAGGGLLVAQCENVGIQTIKAGTIDPHYETLIDCSADGWVTWNCKQSYFVATKDFNQCWGSDSGYNCVKDGNQGGKEYYGGTCNDSPPGGCNAPVASYPTSVPNFALQHCTGG